MTNRTLFAAVVALTCAAGTARAQSVPAPAAADRFTEGSSVGASVGYMNVDADDAFGARFDVYGQYVSPAGFGGYLALPFTYVDDPSDSDSSIGNLEVGGLYVLQTAQAPVILRGGLVFPLASDEDTLINLVGAFARWTDAPQHYPEATWLRLSASPLFWQGSIFLRGDVGLDIPVAKGDLDELDDKFLRFNAVVGTTTGSVALMGELINSYNLNGDVDDQFVNSLALTGRYLGAGAQPYVSFQLPLDDNLNDIVDFVLQVGVDIPFGQSAAAPPPGGDAPPPPPPGM